MVKAIVNNFRKEFVDKSSSLLIASLGFVAALAWNEAIQSMFKIYFGNSNSIKAKLAYAVVVTLFFVAATLWISKWASKLKR